MAGISSGHTIVPVQINGKYVGSKGESRLLIISSLLACIYYFFSCLLCADRLLVIFFHDIA